MAAAMQKAGATSGGGAMDDIPEEAEDDDEEEEDYLPGEIQHVVVRDHMEDLPSAEQLESEKRDIESAQAEEAEPRRDIDEKEQVDAELFAREMKSALENITRLGQSHQVEFVQKLSDTFCELNGGLPSAEQVSSIFGGIKQPRTTFSSSRRRTRSRTTRTTSPTRRT